MDQALGPQLNFLTQEWNQIIIAQGAKLWSKKERFVTILSYKNTQIKYLE